MPTSNYLSFILSPSFFLGEYAKEWHLLSLIDITYLYFFYLLYRIQQPGVSALAAATERNPFHRVHAGPVAPPVYRYFPSGKGGGEG